MLWYKAWLETRWRFLIGLALLVCAGALVPLGYRQVLALLPLVPAAGGGELGRVLRERAALLTTYRGYVWSQWFGQNMTPVWTLFAALIGTGSLLTQASRGALYTLSMPVSRRRLVGIRASLGLAQLFALAVLPALVVPALSPLIGQRYAVGDALVHAGCIFVGGSMFFALAFLLSTAFNDVWRPPLITLFVAGAFGLAEQLFHDALPTSLVQVMNAEGYFRGAGVPWAGLVVRAALAGGLLYGAMVNIARQDF
jgi:ABC-2 type transport system permease protein